MLLILRLAVAAVFIYHSLPKIKNYKGTAQAIGASANMVLALGLVEFISSVGLILGFYNQLFALLLAIIMVGAIWFKIVKWKVPFMAMDKTGWEFDFILLAANATILFG